MRCCRRSANDLTLSSVSFPFTTSGRPCQLPLEPNTSFSSWPFSHYVSLSLLPAGTSSGSDSEQSCGNGSTFASGLYARCSGVPLWALFLSLAFAAWCTRTFLSQLIARASLLFRLRVRKSCLHPCFDTLTCRNQEKASVHCSVLPGEVPSILVRWILFLTALSQKHVHVACFGSSAAVVGIGRVAPIS